MKTKHIVLIILSFTIFSFVNPNSKEKKIRKIINDTFNVKQFNLVSVLLPNKIVDSLPSKFSNDNFFKINIEESLLGYAYIGTAPSKADEFEFLVLLDKDLIVVKTKILIYREDYGGEIGSKRWLKQFTGKSIDDELKYEKNIIAISGATISVRAMTVAMNNFLKSLNILHQKKIL